MWKEYPVGGYYDTRWLTTLWATQATVEGIVLKAARHLGSKSSVVNDPLGEQTFRPRGAQWTVTTCFPPVSWESSLNGDSERYE